MLEDNNTLVVDPKTPLLREINNSEKTTSKIPFYKILFVVTKDGIVMSLSYSFSISVVLTSIMISHLNKENPDPYLGAAALIVTTTNFLAVIPFSPDLAMIIKGSKNAGKLMLDLPIEKKEKIRKKIADIFKSGIILGTVSATLFSFPCMYFSENILTNWFQQDKYISELVQQYLRPYSFAIPGLILRVCLEQMMFSFGKKTPTMIISLCSLVIGTGLAYFLAFESPKLGLKGIAYGYVVEAWLTSLGFGLYIGFNKAFKDIKFFDFFHLNKKDIYHQVKKLLKMGLPITAQLGCELSAMVVIGLLSGRLGVDKLAAQNSAVQVFIFAIIPLNAFAQAVAQQASWFNGLKEFSNAMRFSRYGLLATVGLVSLICVPISIFPKSFIEILAVSIGDKAMEIAKGLLPLAAGQVIADAASIGMIQSSRAAGDLFWPTFIKILCLWSGVFAAYLLGFKTSLDIEGINIGFLSGVLLGSLILLPRWLNRTTSMSFENSMQPAKESTKSTNRFCFPFCTKKSSVNNAPIVEEVDYEALPVGNSSNRNLQPALS